MVAPGEINCGIFRHGVYRTGFEQIPPHASKQVCDELYVKNLIYGCGKPLRYNHTTKSFEVCGYI
jgi:hypothetical protein